MSVSVLVPWRGGDPHRERAWVFLQGLWRERHPDWQMLVGEAPSGPWCKAAAVSVALEHATGDVLVVADADVWTDGLGEAVERVLAGAPWAVPHWHVCRLDATSTAAVLDGAAALGGPAAFDRRRYVGRRGGGVVVLARELYRRVPLDPRFLGWGQEDDAWALALRAVAGKEWRGLADLWHLWHPPQDRRDVGRGSEANVALWREYQAAARAGRIESVLPVTA